MLQLERERLRDRLVYRAGAVFIALCSVPLFVGAGYNLWDGWWFAAGCFFVVTLPLLIVAVGVWRWGNDE